ncbi:hypothetical protein [Serratia fonticola]|uniref:magnesium chelatase subunit ChlI family protein n=1 Tax=Serratia fonticola TaxID=47917 RepID=UPI003F5CCD67
MPFTCSGSGVFRKNAEPTGLSVRAWHRILKVARTLADLTGEQQIDKRHLSEALSYRSMDRLLLQLHRSLE